MPTYFLILWWRRSRSVNWDQIYLSTRIYSIDYRLTMKFQCCHLVAKCTEVRKQWRDKIVKPAQKLIFIPLFSLRCLWAIFMVPKMHIWEVLAHRQKVDINGTCWKVIKPILLHLFYRWQIEVWKYWETWPTAKV